MEKLILKVTQEIIRYRIGSVKDLDQSVDKAKLIRSEKILQRMKKTLRLLYPYLKELKAHLGAREKMPVHLR
jgi:hypothetical protein